MEATAVHSLKICENDCVFLLVNRHDLQFAPVSHVLHILAVDAPRELFVMDTS